MPRPIKYHTKEEAKAAIQEDRKRSEAKLKAAGESYRPRLSVPELELLQMARAFGIEKLTQELAERNGDLDLGDDLPLPAEIPDGWCKPIPPYVIPGPRKILGLWDIHAPAHDKEKLQAALKYGKRQGCDAVFIGGDFLDGYKISRFAHTPNAPSFQLELQIGVQILTAIAKYFPNALRIFKIGNHEDRLDNYIRNNAPELWTDEGDAIKDRLRLKELDYSLVLSSQITTAGDLGLFHGHEIPGGGTVAPARNKFLRAYANIICGHHHTSQSFSVRTVHGKELCSWIVGMLASVAQEYARINQYTQGFAIIETEASGEFNVENKRFINGEIRSV